MEGKRIKVFGVVMALLLVFSLAATLSVSTSTSIVSAGTQKWTKISVPDTDNMQLAPGTDIGPIAVSPDGGTLLVAVFNANASDQWSVYRSTDGGYNWKVTGLTGTFLAGRSDTTDIVAIDFSPDWDNDNRVYVATAYDVYSSKDGGKTFTSKGATAIGVTSINSMDVSLDENGDPIVAIATTGAGALTNVFILGEGGWESQHIEFGWNGATPPFTPSVVLAVSFSPNFAEDGAVFAVVTDGTSTFFCGESDTSVNNWGSFIQNAPFTYDTGNVLATHASLAFAEDYNSVPCAFVGLSDGIANPNQHGDAFRVDLVTGIISTSAVADLNIRGEDTATNIWSIAVSGPSSSAFILVGLTELNPVGPSSTWMGQVHYSQNGGETWLQSYKPAGGMFGTAAYPIVVMAPDFAESGIAYCGNGYMPGTGANMLLFSGFFVSTTKGTTWNGRGLLDNTLDSALGDSVSDIEPSPDYETDSTLFMVTRDANYIPIGPKDFGLLWKTVDGGSHWELICGMTLAMPLPGQSVETVRIPATYPDDPEVFLTGRWTAGVVGAAQPNTIIARSTDEGNLFASTLNAPWRNLVPLVVDDWIVYNDETLIVSNGSDIFKTTDFGAHWKLPTAADIDTSASETVTQLVQYRDTNTVAAATDFGNVYLCTDWETDFSFTQVSEGPGEMGDGVVVTFDTNFDENGMMYAGVTGTNQGIWRVDANSGDEWEQIFGDPDEFTADDEVTGVDMTVTRTPTSIRSIACDGNGILWAITDVGYSVISGNYTAPALTLPVREVNPTAPISDFSGSSPFEYVYNGLDSDLWFDLETAPTQTFVFAIGGGNMSVPQTEVWAYIDTLLKPTLISPDCGATATGTIIEGSSMAMVTLMWEDMAKATWYEYQIAYDDEFGSIVEEGELQGTQASAELYLGEQYYWRVRASEPVVSQWSEVCDFTTPLGPNSAKPIITYPGAMDSHTDIGCPLTLTWTSAVEATGFELVLAQNCDWSNPIVNLTGSSALGPDTCYTLPNCLEQGASYCWKVRAVNEDTDTMSPWSDTGTFTTVVIPVEEEEGTPMWVWVVIALSAILLVGVVVLIIRTRRPV